MTAPTPTLRGYQEAAISKVFDAFRNGQRRVLLSLPTGAGKTVVFANIIAQGYEAGRRMLVLAHREELIDQAAERLRAFLPDEAIGIVRGEEDDPSAPVVVASVQTIRNPKRLIPAGEFNLIVIDEAHHSLAKSYLSILERLGALNDAPEGPKVLGVTATPTRADGKGLEEVFQKLAYSVDILTLIEQGYLTDVMAKRVSLDVNLDGVQRRAGDFAEGALGTAMANTGAPEQIARAISQYANDRVCLVFVPTVELAHKTARAIREAGISAAAVDGKTPDNERQQVIADLQCGALRAVVNCSVFTEGTDIPAVECVVMARPTCSSSLYAQMAGRGLRLHPGKDNCLILDMVGNTSKHVLQGPASLLGDDFEGIKVREGETVKEAAVRYKRELLAIPKGRLVAFSAAPFDTSDVAWVRSPDGHMILPGYHRSRPLRGYALRLTANDRCTLYKLVEEVETRTYIAKCLIRDMTITEGKQRAEQMAETADIYLNAKRDAAWRLQPASKKQRDKIWRLGTQGFKAGTNVKAIRTKGEANAVIACMLADRALSIDSASRPPGTSSDPPTFESRSHPPLGTATTPSKSSIHS